MEIKPGYKQTDIGVIPEEWEVKSLVDIGIALIGLTYNPINVVSDGQLVLRSSNIVNGKLKYEDNVFVKMIVPEKAIAHENDILICVRNGSRDLIGKCAKIDKTASGMAFGAFMTVFRTPYHDYVYHQFQSRTIESQIKAHLGATINQITNASLNSFQIPFPPVLAEQQAIAEVLNDADAHIDSLEQLIAKKHQIKQGAMQGLLTGKTRLPGFSRDWEIKLFDDVLYRINAKAYQIPTTSYQPIGTYPVVDQGKDLVVGYYEDDDKVLQCPQGGVIVFGDHTCIVKYIDFNFIIGADGTQIITAKPDHSTRFYAYLLQFSGITPTGYNRHFKFLKERSFLVPTLPEQTMIATIIQHMDSEIEALKEKLCKIRQIKQGMMHELLTGRIRLV